MRTDRPGIALGALLGCALWVLVFGGAAVLIAWAAREGIIG